jgi:hypothetical protein
MLAVILTPTLTWADDDVERTTIIPMLRAVIILFMIIF